MKKFLAAIVSAFCVLSAYPQTLSISVNSSAQIVGPPAALSGGFALANNIIGGVTVSPADATITVVTNFATNVTLSAAAMGLLLTNYASTIGLNGTNFANAIGLNGSNYSAALSLNGTNYALSIVASLGANDTNFAQTIGTTISNLISYKFAVSNLTVTNLNVISNAAVSGNLTASNVTSSGIISGNGSGLTNVPNAGNGNFTSWGQTVAIVSNGPSGSFNFRLEEADPSWDGTNWWIFYSGWTNFSGTTGGGIGLLYGGSLNHLTNLGEVISPIAATWCSNYVSGPRQFIYNGNRFVNYFGSTNNQFEGGPSSIGQAYALLGSTNFTQETTNPIIAPYGQASWATNNMFRPWETGNAAGTLFYMLINCNSNSGGGEQIGLWTASSVSGPWTGLAANPRIFTNANAGEFGNIRVGDINGFWDGQKWDLFLFGGDNVANFPKSGFLTSTDLTNFSPYVPLNGPMFASNGNIFPLIRPAIAFSNGFPYLFTDNIGSNLYVSVNGGVSGIGILTNVTIRTGVGSPPANGTIPGLDIFSGYYNTVHGVQLSDAGKSSAIWEQDSVSDKHGSEGLRMEFYTAGAFSGTQISGGAALTIDANSNTAVNSITITNGLTNLAGTFVCASNASTTPPVYNGRNIWWYSNGATGIYTYLITAAHTNLISAP